MARPGGNPDIGKLSPWKPGISGNPAGRPKKGTALTDLLEKVGEINYKDTGIARKKLLAEKMWDAAIEGTWNVAEYIFDRIDGKIPDKLDYTGLVNTNISDEISVDNLPVKLRKEYHQEQLRLLNLELNKANADKKRLGKK